MPNNLNNATMHTRRNKAIQPVKIKTPDAWMLPDRVLEDQEIVEAFPELVNLEILDSVELMPNKDVI